MILMWHCRSRSYTRWPSFSSPAYIPQQHQSQPSNTLLQSTLAHARAAAAAGQECLQELVERVQGRQQPADQQAVKRPGQNVPAGMLKLTLHDVELTTPGLCFCVLKIGPHWGRTSTLTASPKAAWDWEVTLTCCAWDCGGELAFEVLLVSPCRVVTACLCTSLHVVSTYGSPVTVGGISVLPFSSDL